MSSCPAHAGDAHGLCSVQPSRSQIVVDGEGFEMQMAVAFVLQVSDRVFDVLLRCFGRIEEGCSYARSWTVRA